MGTILLLTLYCLNMTCALAHIVNLYFHTRFVPIRYKFAGGDGQIKVLKGAMVVMKGKWQHSTYTLLGNTMMGTVVVSYASKQDNDCTKL